MADKIYIDTHIAIILFSGDLSLLTEKVKALLQRSKIYISPSVELELQLFYEQGKIKQPARNLISTLKSEIGLTFCDLEFVKVSEEACKLNWTNNIFDRLIVAQASLGNNILITKNESIRINYPRAYWL